MSALDQATNFTSSNIGSSSNHRCLLLSSNYEPMRVVSAERAIILEMNGKVDIVERSDKFYRSPSIQYQLPSIIRYKTYTKRQHRVKLRLSKRAIALRDMPKGCAYCTRFSPDGFKSIKDFSVDHVISKFSGGKNSWTNLIGCCKRCNEKKGSKSLEEAGMFLRYQPHEPTPLMTILRRNDLNGVPESWKMYFYV